MFDDVPAIAEKSRRARKQLDSGGSPAVLGCLSRLGEAAPDGARNRYGGFVVCTHLDDRPRGSAEAGGASLEAGSVVKDVALKSPEVAVADFAIIFDIFDAPFVGSMQDAKSGPSPRTKAAHEGPRASASLIRCRVATLVSFQHGQAPH